MDVVEALDNGPPPPVDVTSPYRSLTPDRGVPGQ
jgi:hypothetical protein